MSAEDPLAEQAPAFSVVKGQASDEELAAVTVVLASLRRERGGPRPPTGTLKVGGWKSYWHLMSQGFATGREGWRATFRR